MPLRGALISGAKARHSSGAGVLSHVRDLKSNIIPLREAPSPPSRCPPPLIGQRRTQPIRLSLPFVALLANVIEHRGQIRHALFSHCCPCPCFCQFPAQFLGLDAPLPELTAHT